VTTVRLLVTGSRTWRDRDALFDALDRIAHRFAGRDLILVHGACPQGADKFAAEWAESRQAITPEPHPADWDRYGRAAGPVRNKEMVAAGADLAVTFIAQCGCPGNPPGPHGTHGSVHCANLAARAGIPIHHVRPTP
jgi:hypothetical protein